MRKARPWSSGHVLMLLLGILPGSGWACAQGNSISQMAGGGGPPERSPIRYRGEPISMRLVNASLVDFFRVVSELSGLNVMIDPDVQGAITMNVEEVPWDQLFDVVLKSHRLVKSVEGNVVRISTLETSQVEGEAAQTLKRLALLTESTQILVRRLEYADAKKLFESLSQETVFLSERGRLFVDERTNTLFLRDVPEQIRHVEQMLDAIDVPERQVEIEARIIEATTRFARDIGVKLGLIIGGFGARNQGKIDVSAPVEKPVGTGSFVSGGLLDTFRLDAMISAAEREGHARVLSKPRVSTQNNAEATITQGARIPIPVQANFSTSVRFEAAALRLTVNPQITSENTIALRLKLENNVPDFSRTVLGIPTILTSEAETQVLLPDGGTTVIGGIFVEIERDSRDRVPGVRRIPILGHLFTRNSSERETREILFFLTPKIKQ